VLVIGVNLDYVDAINVLIDSLFFKGV